MPARYDLARNKLVHKGGFSKYLHAWREGQSRAHSKKLKSPNELGTSQSNCELFEQIINNYSICTQIEVIQMGWKLAHFSSNYPGIAQYCGIPWWTCNVMNSVQHCSKQMTLLMAANLQAIKDVKFKGVTAITTIWGSTNVTNENPCYFQQQPPPYHCNFLKVRQKWPWHEQNVMAF